MAQFSAKKIDTTTINGGQQVVNGSGVTPELFNAPVESALYTEKAIEVLTSNIDTSDADVVGTPTVSFSSKTEGGVEYKYLKFANLKGKTGNTGRTGPEGPEGKIGPVGPKGETGEAAGFGTPTISVETLEEGSTATASVRATGEDTAKVFNFNFGLPKGDTGRGIETVVSDGNDLIIKYDDGSEERLRGVIQTINALVADSKADFEAAQIEENIGKTISYKGDLYLIIGEGRTKLVNNGVTDYNALSNIPVYIATTQDQFNEYLQSYNVGKIVSYDGSLYLVKELVWSDGSITYDYDVIGSIDGKDYSVLNNLPIVWADLSDANTHLNDGTYYKHQGETTDLYVFGKIYYYKDGELKPIDGSSGGGITDVQVNGTSVVADGVASIPAAAYGNEGGILTSGTQSIKGYKKFDSIGIIYPNSNASAVCGYISGTSSASMRVSKSSTYGSIEIGGSNNTVATKNVVEVNNTDGICFINPPSVEKNVKAIKTFKGSTEKSAVIFSYDISGVVMASPETWNSATVGSATLPASGLYEVKFNVGADDGQIFVVHAILYWDGSLPTSEERKRIVATAGTIGEVGVWAQMNGSINVTSYTDGYTIANNEVSYRKIGIA